MQPLVRVHSFKMSCALDLKILGLRVAPAAPQFDEAALGQLQAMGFGLNACQRALLATGNSDAEAATNWLFMHMEDPGA